MRVTGLPARQRIAESNSVYKEHFPMSVVNPKQVTTVNENQRKSLKEPMRYLSKNHENYCKRGETRVTKLRLG